MSRSNSLPEGTLADGRRPRLAHLKRTHVAALLELDAAQDRADGDLVELNAGDLADELLELERRGLITLEVRGWEVLAGVTQGGDRKLERLERRAARP